MEVFRIAYAAHFVLGAYLAMRLRPCTVAIFGLISVPDITFGMSFVALSVNALALLWYFVWYGSIQFAIRGEFPLVSTRQFAAIVAAVYFGAGVLSAYNYNESLAQYIHSQSPFVLTVAVMLLLAGATAIVLPKQQRVWELETQRIRQVRDEQLDQMYRINNPRIRP